VKWKGHDMSMQVRGNGGFFAMMNMGSHTQGKTVHGKCDNRIIMFEKQMIFRFTLLPLDYPYLPRHTDTTYDLSTLSEGVKISDLEQLKTDAAKCLTDSLFKKLLDVEEVTSYWNEHALSKLSFPGQPANWNLLGATW